MQPAINVPRTVGMGRIACAGRLPIDDGRRRMLTERQPPRGARAAVKLMTELYENQVKIAALIERERRSRDELRDLDREIDDLRHNPVRRIALPDDSPDDAAHV